MHRHRLRTARFLRRTFFQIPIPVAQPALELEPKIPGAVFRHLCALAPFLDEMSSVRQAYIENCQVCCRPMSLRLRLGVHERQVVGTRAFSSSSTVLALSALDFDTAVRDPHGVRRDALLSRWALDVAIGYAEAGPVPWAGDDIAL